MPVVLRIILPILVGAVIGYFTNYIAIKMLFRPRKAVYIGKFRLPFTPGIIPKNQPRIARAAGNAVASQLLTSSDLVDRLISDSVKSELAERITAAVIDSEISPAGLLEGFTDPDKTAENIGGFITDRITAKVSETDLRPTIDGLIAGGLSEYRKNPMVALFLSQSAMDGIGEKVEQTLREWLDGDGRDMIRSLVTNEISGLMDAPVKNTAESAGINRDGFKSAVLRVIDKAADRLTGEITSRVDISGIICEKIEAMDVATLEELVMSVMKNELQAVINLGAVIGAVIGAVNIFI